MINVLIVDDEKLIREGLSILFKRYEDVEVVGTCSNGEEAYNFCKSNSVDIVLMDIRMPVVDGVTGTKLIKQAFPHINVLILTTFTDDEYIKEALKSGASGYLLKDSSPDMIYGSIINVIQGNIVMSPSVADVILKGDNKAGIDVIKCYGLTEREIAIIRLITEGLSNKEIGEQLYITEGTVKNNITLILSKLSLKDRTQIAIFAFRNNIATN